MKKINTKLPTAKEINEYQDDLKEELKHIEDFLYTLQNLGGDLFTHSFNLGKFLSRMDCLDEPASDILRERVLKIIKDKGGDYTLSGSKILVSFPPHGGKTFPPEELISPEARTILNQILDRVSLSILEDSERSEIYYGLDLSQGEDVCFLGIKRSLESLGYTFSIDAQGEIKVSWK